MGAANRNRRTGIGRKKDPVLDSVVFYADDEDSYDILGPVIRKAIQDQTPRIRKTTR